MTQRGWMVVGALVGLIWLLPGCATAPAPDAAARTEALIAAVESGEAELEDFGPEPFVALMDELLAAPATVRNGMAKAALIPNIGDLVDPETATVLLASLRTDTEALDDPSLDLLLAVTESELAAQRQNYDNAATQRQGIEDGLATGVCDVPNDAFKLWCMRAHLSSAVLSQALGDLPAARESFQASETHHRPGYLQSEYYLLLTGAGDAMLDFQMGNAQRSADRMVEVSKRAEKLPPGSFNSVLYSNTAYILHHMGRMEESAYWTQKFLETCLGPLPPADCESGRLLMLRAMQLKADGEQYRAIASLSRLHDHLVSTGQGDTSFAHNVRSVIATTFLDLGQYRQALNWSELGEKQNSELKGVDDASRAVFVMAAAQASSALSGYEEAVVENAILMMDDYLASDPLPIYRSRVLATKSAIEINFAQIASRQDYAQRAILSARASVDQLEDATLTLTQAARATEARGRFLLGEPAAAFDMIDGIIAAPATPLNAINAAIMGTELSASSGDWSRFAKYETILTDVLTLPGFLPIVNRTDPGFVKRSRQFSFLRLKRDAAKGGDPAEAYERAQSVFLNSGGDTLQLSLLAQGDPELDAQLREIEALASRRADLLGDETGQSASAEGRVALASELTNIDSRLLELEASIFQSRPQFATLGLQQAVTASETAGALRDGEAFLQIASGGDLTHVFLVLPDGHVSWHRVDISYAKLCGLVDRVRRHLDPVGRPVCPNRAMADTGRVQFDEAAARELYTLILAPLEPRLANSDTLVMAIDGPLASLPFATLLTTAPPERDNPLAPPAYGDLDWLIKDFAILRVPDAATYVTLGQQAAVSRRGGGEGLMAIGAPCIGMEKALRCPDFSADQISPVPRVAAIDFDQLPPLPGAARELRNIVDGYPGESVLLIGEDATEARLRSNIQDRFSTVLVATHVLSVGEMGANEPGIVLSPGKSDDARFKSDDDGFLSASEVASEVRFGSDFIILAGCNSASSLDGNQATPLNGLARSFFAGGSRRIVMSHTPLRDDVSELFTSRLVNGEEEAHQILRATMTELIADAENPALADPAAWASLVVVGRP
jgi:CHAT domain-containing protein/tetratricopeptide (TPR) repeat protein